MAKSEKGPLVTIYKSGEMMGSIVKYVGYLDKHWVGNYAQYQDAAFVRFTPKGKRLLRQLTDYYNKSLLIVEGDGPEPDDMWGKSETQGEGVNAVTVKQGRYSSCSPQWRVDFNNMIDPLIANGTVKVVADYRSPVQVA